MKKTTTPVKARAKKVKGLNLKKISKDVRKLVREQREEKTLCLLDDLRSLFTQSSITNEDFRNLFKKHFSSVVMYGQFDIENMSFKEDGTPNLRTLPKRVRDVYKEFLAKAESEKTERISTLLSNMQTCNDDDLKILQDLCETNSFTRKWVSDNPSTLELEKHDVVLQDDDFFSNF